MVSGEMSPEQYVTFLTEVLCHHARNSISGSMHFVCMDWRHMNELLRAGAATYDELKNLCVWKKSNAGMGSLYRSQHELVFVFRHGKGSSINNVNLGAHGRNRSNVWDYAGQTALTGNRAEELAMHPTVKPVRLVADAILDCSKRGGLILDGFSGSGTTIVAAEQTGRLACALELDPQYVDVAVRRWEKLTGELAEHATLGRTFKELTRERQEPAAAGETVAQSLLPPSSQDGGCTNEVAHV
jgi:hypothetical protein